MPQVEKLIITNRGALDRKYGRGVAKITDAVDALIASDHARGMTTQLVAVDDAAGMKRRHAPVVRDAGSCRQNKDAIDALQKGVRPDYLVLLGATDVIPHQDLTNPLFHEDGDDDERAWGDLPYACEAPYSRDARRFRSPTRVVGRIPDVTGGRDPAYLVGVLRTAARYKQRSRDDYETCFGVTALAWKGSTALSIRNVFGPDVDLNTSPPRGPRWSAGMLGRRMHFINCHGDTADIHFYGEDPRTESKPVSHSAEYLDHAKGLQEGTVVAAECCYGAELYDPTETRGQLGICNTYLRHGAYGFVGSSTIAYGPESGNGYADLLCQYFLERVLRGASIGRALLEARQRYVQASGVLDPAGLKTLAQFSLMGDPSVQPVGRAPHALARSRVAKRVMTTPEAKAAARLQRREWLVRYGVAVGDMTAVTRRRARPPQGRALELVERTVREGGARRVNVTSHHVVDPAGREIRAQLGDGARDRAVHVGIGKTGQTRPFGRRRMRPLVAVIAIVDRGRILGVHRLVSK
jgi:hypothetical protein